MTCRCNFHSPFKWATFPQPSQFMQDEKFWKGAASGKTMAAIQTEAMQRFEVKHGRSGGSIPGLSDKADKQTEAHMHRRRAASHYGKKA